MRLITRSGEPCGSAMARPPSTEAIPRRLAIGLMPGDSFEIPYLGGSVVGASLAGAGGPFFSVFSLGGGLVGGVGGSLAEVSAAEFLRCREAVVGGTPL